MVAKPASTSMVPTKVGGCNGGNIDQFFSIAGETCAKAILKALKELITP